MVTVDTVEAVGYHASTTYALSIAEDDKRAATASGALTVMSAVGAVKD